MQALLAFDLYVKNRPDSVKNESTWHRYCDIVRDFTELNSHVENYKDLFNVECLEKYVLSSTDYRMRFYAVRSFFDVLQKHDQSIVQRKLFPLGNDIVEKQAKKEKNGKAEGLLFLDKNVDLFALFDDKYYEHLNNEMASLTVKAAIAIAISACYPSTAIDSTNKDVDNKMKVSNYSDHGIYGVKVKNLANPGLRVAWILIQGVCSECLKEYFKHRKNIQVNTDAFFTPIWSKKVEYNKEITRNRPSTVYNLVHYMLKYISIELALPFTITLKNLRANSILLFLYRTKGLALPDIINTFGYQSFVKNAFEHYSNNTYSPSELGVYPFISEDDSFFTNSSLKEVENEGIGDAERLFFFKRNVQVRMRNQIKINKIKRMYNNTCQVCGNPLVSIQGFSYSEGHHIQPHGRPHYGIDDYANMLVLCPNHHVLFDLGLIAIDPEDLSKIIHIDKNNVLNGKKIWVLDNHNISHSCVRYHYLKIFSRVHKKVNGGF